MNRGDKFKFFCNIVPRKTSELHPVIKKFLSRKEIPNVSLACKLEHFLSNWQRITAYLIILVYVGGYKITTLETPCQTQSPPLVKIKEEQRLIVQKEVLEILRKEAIVQTQNNLKQFLGSILLVLRKSAGF